MRGVGLLFICVCSFLSGMAQPVGRVMYKNFDREELDFGKVRQNVDSSEYIHAAFTPVYSAGLFGKALDLTDEVAVRMPVRLEKTECPSYDKSFTVNVWVKTKPGAQQGTAILGNKKNKDFTSSGWLIGTHENGAWYFTVSDGKMAYRYEPTPERQAINDGRWHQLGVIVDLEKQVMWCYFDGRNVAVYNIEGLKGAASDAATVIGGTDEYYDWGSRGEWTAFNGKVDEVSLWNGVLTADDMLREYGRFFPEMATVAPVAPDRLKVQVWNIWHGGHRFGQYVGVSRVIEVLKAEDADIIGLIETYGSGAVIADALGYYYYLISSNLSIMSRYPIKEVMKLYHSFKAGGALLDIGGGREIAFFDVWLDYLPDICRLMDRHTEIKEFLQEDEKTRVKDVRGILGDMTGYTARASQVPVIVAGDFNCGSHRDWTEKTRDIHGGLVVDWKTSREMEAAGYTDSYREMNPDPLKDPGFTWSPLINPAASSQNCIRDRIDFIYYKGGCIIPYRSRVLTEHPKFWPSDHGSIVTWFYVK